MLKQVQNNHVKKYARRVKEEILKLSPTSKLFAIKAVRDALDMSLVQAKNLVEVYEYRSYLVNPNEVDKIMDGAPMHVEDLIDRLKEVSGRITINLQGLADDVEFRILDMPWVADNE